MEKLLLKYKNKSAQELLDIYLEKDDELAFCELYTRHTDKLMGFFMSRCRRDRSLCKDLIQDTYLELLLSKAFNGNTINEFGGYIMRIGNNIWCKYSKTDKKRKDNESERQRTHHEEYENNENSVNKEQRTKILELKINQLPSEDQITAIRLWMNGKSYREVAEIMDKKVSEVTNLIYRAKRNLGGQTGIL